MTETHQPHESDKRRRRAALLLLPAGLLASLCCIWSLFANVGRGEAEAFIAAPLHSSARANYGEDSLLGGMRSLSISIVESVIRDHDPEANDADARATKVYESMMTEVPTVPGAATATPTLTPASTSTTLPPSDTPGPSATPSPTPTGTLTSTPTGTSSPTPSKTPTPSATPTACKVKPVLEISDPFAGSLYDWTDELMGEARAYDPDNVDPVNCAPIGSFTADNGTGIVKIEFKIIYIDGGNVQVHEQDQFSVRYCAFTGTALCLTHGLGPPFEWPGGATIGSGEHELKARAQDDEGQWSEWTDVHFFIDVDPTPTPFNSPTPSLTPSLTPSPTPSLTPSPTPNLCSSITLTNFYASGKEIFWDLTNGTGSTITITEIYLDWPTANVKLKKVRLDGSDIHNPDDNAPPTDITSGWTGSTNVASGPAVELRFEFENDPAEATGYSIDVTFDTGCVASATVP